MSVQLGRGVVVDPVPPASSTWFSSFYPRLRAAHRPSPVYAHARVKTRRADLQDDETVSIWIGLAPVGAEQTIPLRLILSSAAWVRCSMSREPRTNTSATLSPCCPRAALSGQLRFDKKGAGWNTLGRRGEDWR